MKIEDGEPSVSESGEEEADYDSQQIQSPISGSQILSSDLNSN